LDEKIIVVIISKTDHWLLSPLDPIAFGELQSLSTALPTVTVHETRTYRNPFTQELSVVKSPWLEVSLEPKSDAVSEFSLLAGRLICDDFPDGANRDEVRKVAKHLGARVAP